MPETIQINFSRSFPVFPLPEVCLLPHASAPLHIFEPRYVRLVGDCLDTSNQIAMATFKGSQWKHEFHGNPPIRNVVCIGQIERYEKLPMDRYNVIIQGVCRARVIEEEMPTESRPYRAARLAPIEMNADSHEAELFGWRQRIQTMLENTSLQRIRLSESIAKCFHRDDIPSHVLIEIVGHLLMTTSDDAERRYHLLAEPDTLERADYTEDQLRQLEHLIRVVSPQTCDWPKGCSWN